MLDFLSRPSPTGPLSPSDSVTSLDRPSPVTHTRNSAPTITTTTRATTGTSQATSSNVSAYGTLAYAWEAHIAPRPSNKLYRDPLAGMAPSLWGLGPKQQRRHSEDACRPVCERDTDRLYNMLQGIKDEGTDLAGRPYTAQLPQHATHAVHAAGYGAQGRARRASCGEAAAGERRTRFVWRPRSGFAGVLAVAPAGMQAMLQQVRGSVPQGIARELSMRRATYSSPTDHDTNTHMRPATAPAAAWPAMPPTTPLSHRPPALSLHVIGNHHTAAAAPVSKKETKMTSHQGVEPVPEEGTEEQKWEQQDTGVTDHDTGVPVPEQCASPVVRGSAVDGGVLVSPSTARTPGRSTVRSSAGTSLSSSRVWVGARGKVVNGQLVP